MDRSGLSDSPVLELFHNTVQSPPDAQSEYQTVKENIFHTFQMIPTPRDHGMQPTFLHETHNHLLRWDPLSCESVDKACQKYILTLVLMKCSYRIHVLFRSKPHVMFHNQVFLFHLSFMSSRLLERVWMLKPKHLCSLRSHGPKHLLYLIWLMRVIYLTTRTSCCTKRLVLISLSYRSGSVCVEPTRLKGVPMVIFIANLVLCMVSNIYISTSLIQIDDYYAAGPRLTVNCLTDYRTWFNLQVMTSCLLL